MTSAHANIFRVTIDDQMAVRPTEMSKVTTLDIPARPEWQVGQVVELRAATGHGVLETTGTVTDLRRVDPWTVLARIEWEPTLQA